MLRFSLTTLLIGTVVIALACAALLNPNIYFAASFQVAMIVTALTSVLMAIVCRGDRQRMAIGFAVFVIGWQVWLSFLGDSIKLPDRIAFMIAVWQEHEPSFSRGFGELTLYPPANNTFFEPSFEASKTSRNIPNGTPGSAYQPLDYGSLKAIIQSLFSLAAGLLGVTIAMLLTRLEQNRSPKLAKQDE